MCIPTSSRLAATLLVIICNRSLYSGTLSEKFVRDVLTIELRTKPVNIILRIIIATDKPRGTLCLLNQNIAGLLIAVTNSAIRKGEIILSANLMPASIITNAASDISGLFLSL